MPMLYRLSSQRRSDAACRCLRSLAHDFTRPNVQIDCGVRAAERSVTAAGRAASLGYSLSIRRCPVGQPQAATPRSAWGVHAYITHTRMSARPHADEFMHACEPSQSEAAEDWGGAHALYSEASVLLSRMGNDTKVQKVRSCLPPGAACLLPQ